MQLAALMIKTLNKVKDKAKIQLFSKFCKTIHFFVFQFLVLIIGLPYTLWKIIVPKVNWSRILNFVSQKMRLVLEFKKARHAIGINLTVFLVIALIMQLYFLNDNDVNADSSEVFIKQPELVQISTENTFRKPVIGYISQYFTNYHNGIDIAGNDFCDVFPISSGKVVEISKSSSDYGLSILIQHNNGLISRYAHLSKIRVSINQIVDKNTNIGLIGSTGRSTGPHLHLEIYENGLAVNPLSYISDEFAVNYGEAMEKTTIIAQTNEKKVNIAELEDEISFKTREVSTDFQPLIR